MNYIYMIIIVFHLGFAKDCIVKDAVEVCADYSNPPFFVRINSYAGHAVEEQDKAILAVGEKPLGPSLGISHRACSFPNRLGRNSDAISDGTELPKGVTSFLYLGFLNPDDLGEQPICHAFCSESFCPDIQAPACNTLLITFEGPLTGNKVLGFLGKVGTVNPLTKITCYLKQFDLASLNYTKHHEGIAPLCSQVFLEMSFPWTSKQPCPFNPLFPQTTNLSSKYTPHFLVVPAFGYRLTVEDSGFENQICSGPFSKKIKPDVNGSCLTDSLSSCTFADPKSVWKLVEEQSDKGNIHGFYLLSSGLLKSSNAALNQAVPNLSPADILEFMHGLGREYSLSDEQSHCFEIKTDTIASCIWVETIDIDEAGECVGEDLETGYIGRVVCDFSCDKEFTVVECDLMTCHELEPPPKAKTYYYWVLEAQIVIESGGQYAWVDKERTRQCLGEGRFLVCQGKSTPEYLCSSSSCWAADFKLAPLSRLGKPCLSLSCFLDHKPATSRNLLQIEALSDCKSQIVQEGLAMKVFSVSNSKITTLCLQTSKQRKCVECEGTVCHLDLDLDFAEVGEEVLSDCDGVVTPLLWATKYNVGEKVGLPQLDYIMTSWASAERYWKWIFAFALLAFLQMTVWTIKILGLHHVLKKFFICLFKVLFATPSFLREVWNNFFWFRRRYHYCPGCGGDINFLDHTEDTCTQTEHYCKFLIAGGICGETISESQSHFRHWVLMHLPGKVMKLVFWINPLNVWKFYQVKLTHTKLPTKRQEIEERKEVFRGPSKRKPKGYTIPLLGVAVLSLISPADSVVNLVPSTTCSKGICSMSTSGVIDNLYSGSMSCFKAASEGANLEFCLSVKAVLITSTCQVVKCRVEPEVKFFGTFRCTNAWAESLYKNELEKFKDCTQFASRNEARVGGYDWGCSLPNANSIFVKGYLSDSKLPTPCIIDTTGGWSVKSVLCVTTGGDTNCDNSAVGKVRVGSLNITYTTEFPGKVDLPDKLLVMPDGSFRKVLDESNGCFSFSKKKIGGSDCSYPINYPSYACGYTIDPSGVSGHCTVPESRLCEDPLSFPLFNSGSCFLTGAMPSIDSNSFFVSGRGCTDGRSSLRFEAVGTVEIAPISGSVIDLEIHDCLGYSGISLGASCLVFPKCDGMITTCSLTSPTVLDIPCGSDTRVFFSGSDKSNATFKCGNSAVSLPLNLTIVMPQRNTQALISSSILVEKSSSYPAGFTFLVIVAVISFIVLAVFISFFLAKKIREIKSSNYSEKML